MRLSESIRNNLIFLLAEAGSQVGNLRGLLDGVTQDSTSNTALDRRSYAYNLKMRIHDGCINEWRRRRSKGAQEPFSLRAAEAIASELERITNLAYDCARQIEQTDREASRGLPATELVDHLQGGLQLVRDTLEGGDSKPALKINEVSRKVSKEYDKFFAERSRGLRKMKRPDHGIPVLFIAYGINEMAAALSNISEAIMTANLGRPMRIERLRTLESAFEDLGLENRDADVEPIAETRSGSGISGISDASQNGYLAILKDGKKRKMKEERESVESWHEIFPGLAPQILSYRKRGEHASLLIEHLPGLTFEQILLGQNSDLLATTLRQLTKTLKAVWDETKRPEPVFARHMSQLRNRLEIVREVHGELGGGAGSICGAKLRSLPDLIDAAEKLEGKIEPPFSVYIHGDFNLDNIIFDPGERRINFIDLRRSCDSDYVQDVSVFMVSNYRLQVLNARTRRRIHRVAVAFHKFASGYARRSGDDTFELRLGFGLARSFITSTRFILDKSLAEAMYLRGIYILERILEYKKKTASEFKLPIRELF